MGSTLLLDVAAWDLALDASGNIALATEPYSIVQDVASACRLFAGELFYDTSQGIRYFDQVLGQTQPASVLKDQLVKAALSVPGVLSATVYLSAIEGRTLSGQVQIVTADGVQTLAL